MRNSKKEIFEDYNKGLISQERWLNWLAFFDEDTNRNEDKKRTGTLNANRTTHQQLTLLQKMVVWATEPAHLAMLVIALVFIEPILW